MDRHNYNAFTSLVVRRIKALNLIQSGDTDEVIRNNIADFVDETWLEMANRGNRVVEVKDIDSVLLSTCVSVAVHKLIGRKDQQKLSHTGMTHVPYEHDVNTVPLDLDVAWQSDKLHRFVHVTLKRLDPITEMVIHTVFFVDAGDHGGFNPITGAVNRSAIKNLDPTVVGFQCSDPTDYQWNKLMDESLDKFKEVFLDTRNNWDEYQYYYLTGDDDGPSN